MFSKYIGNLPTLNRSKPILPNIGRYTSTVKMTDIDDLQRKYLNLYQAQEKTRSDLLWCSVFNASVLGCLMVIASNENKKHNNLKNEVSQIQNKIQSQNKINLLGNTN